MKVESTHTERKALLLFLILTPLVSLAIPLFLALPAEAVPLLMVLVPALMAVLLAATTEGGKSAAALLQKLFQWRVGIKWYAAALGLAVGVRLSEGLLALLLGWIPALQFRAWSPQQFLIIGVFALIGAVLEELGWRGYVLPRLLALRPALVSALMIGIPWGVLHLGLTLPGMMNAGTSWAATILHSIGLSVVLTWLYIQARGSLVTVVLYHAGQNLFVFLNDGLTSSQDLWLLTAITLALALVLILLYGANLQRSLVKKPAVVDAGGPGELRDHRAS